MTREMKYSGIEWIGDIPSEWKVEKNKHCFEFTKNIVGEEFENYKLLSLTKKGIVIKDENNSFGKVPDSYETYQSVKQGQLVLCLFDLDCSAVFSGLSNYDGMISPAYKIYNCKECIDKKYAEYWFDYCFDGRKYMIYSKSLRYVVNADDFGTIEIVLPPLSEQKKIADFLDGKVSQIDKIIAETKSSIENYKEYKRSVITEAVTKGLDKNVPMKDSGIEWIGNIPVGWEIMPLKYKCILNEETLTEKTDPNYEFMYIEIGSVSLDKGINKYEKMMFKNSPSRARRIVRENNIIISTVRTYLKAIAVVPNIENVVVSTGFAVIKPKNIFPKYLGYMLKTDYFTNSVSAKSVGVSYPAINASDLIQFKILVPTKKEQQKIADFLDSIVFEIDNLISEKEKLISNLEEYKRSLIYEYVTGEKLPPSSKA